MWLYQIRREAPCSDGALLGKNSLGIVQILQIVQSHASGEKQGSELGKVELMKVPTMTWGGAIHMSKKFLNNACPWKRFWQVIGARIAELAILFFFRNIECSRPIWSSAMTFGTNIIYSLPISLSLYILPMLTFLHRCQKVLLFRLFQMPLILNLDTHFQPINVFFGVGWGNSGPFFLVLD